MTVNVGTMQLPVTEDADLVRTYLNGTHVSGGLWTALTRASNHDHSGGLNGIQLTATSIPDGSITSAKLDPAILLLYALVDGSKPFTGIVTMNADQLIRDTLRFGAKPAGVADATLARTGAGALRVDTHLGVGVNPATWHTALQAVQIGQAGVLRSLKTGIETVLSVNTQNDGTGDKPIVGSASATLLRLTDSAGLQVQTAGAYPLGSAQTFTTRLTLDPAGNLGVGVNPPALGASYRGLFVGQAGSMSGNAAAAGMSIRDNTYNDGTSDRAMVTGASNQLQFGAGYYNFYTAPSVAAGATQTFSLKAQLAPTGTLTLTPDGVTNPFSIARSLTATNICLDASPGFLEVRAASFQPSYDNALPCGNTPARWTAVYAVSGTIQTSSQEMKEGITPLDPAACYQAAKDVRWYEYAYLPPVYTAPEPPPDIAYDAADDNETKAEKKAARDEAEAQAREAHAKMLVETAPARHQRGFVFPAGAESKDEAGGALPPVPDLFGLSDRESTTPQADLATLGAAMQELIRRFEVVEAKVS